MDNYRKLKLKVNKDIENSYCEVNKEIDKIIQQYSSPKAELEELICGFEARCEFSNENSIYAIIYALIIGAVSILSNIDIVEQNTILQIFCACILIVPCIFFISIIFVEKKLVYRDRFILKCLQFKYEELCKTENKMEEIIQDNSCRYIVGVKKID